MGSDFEIDFPAGWSRAFLNSLGATSTAKTVIADAATIRVGLVSLMTDTGGWEGIGASEASAVGANRGEVSGCDKTSVRNSGTVVCSNRFKDKSSTTSVDASGVSSRSVEIVTGVARNRASGGATRTPHEGSDLSSSGVRTVSHCDTGRLAVTNTEGSMTSMLLRDSAETSAAAKCVIGSWVIRERSAEAFSFTGAS